VSSMLMAHTLSKKGIALEARVIACMMITSSWVCVGMALYQIGLVGSYRQIKRGLVFQCQN